MLGKVNFYKDKKYQHYYRLRFKDKFFNQAFKWRLEDDYLILEPVGLDDHKSGLIEPTFDKHTKGYTCGINLEGFKEVPTGNYTFDEDSTEDEIIIYLG